MDAKHATVGLQKMKKWKFQKRSKPCTHCTLWGENEPLAFEVLKIQGRRWVFSFTNYFSIKKCENFVRLRRSSTRLVTSLILGRWSQKQASKRFHYFSAAGKFFWYIKNLFHSRTSLEAITSPIPREIFWIPNFKPLDLKPKIKIHCGNSEN